MTENTAKDPFAFLSAIKVEETELPKREGTGGGKTRAIENNPFTEPLSASFSDKKGRAVTVPAESVQKTEYLIRQAGEDLSIGVRVVLMVDGERVDRAAIKELHKRKNVKVMFQGQKKRAYATRTRRSQNTTETASE